MLPRGSDPRQSCQRLRLAKTFSRSSPPKRPRSASPIDSHRNRPIILTGAPGPYCRMPESGAGIRAGKFHWTHPARFQGRPHCTLPAAYGLQYCLVRCANAGQCSSRRGFAATRGISAVAVCSTLNLSRARSRCAANARRGNGRASSASRNLKLIEMFRMMVPITGQVMIQPEDTSQKGRK